MALLFDRRAKLTIGTIQISVPGPSETTKQGLRFTFDVERTLQPRPNKALIQVYNLNPDHRAELEGYVEVPVQLEAGYADEEPGVLFLGSLRTSISTWASFASPAKAKPPGCGLNMLR